MTVPRVEVSIINKLPMELFNIVLGTINLKTVDTTVTQSIRVSLAELQVDNQLPGADGVVLYMKPNEGQNVVEIDLIVDTSSCTSATISQLTRKWVL